MFAKARFFLLVDLREFFSDLGSGGRGVGVWGGGGQKNENKKSLKMIAPEKNSKLVR